MLLCVTFLTACSSDTTFLSNDALSSSDDTSGTSSSNAVYQKIYAEDAYQMMKNTDEYILLDVRTYEEFIERRIEGAVLIPDYEIGSRAAAELPDKDALILIYCRSGRRSANAANELIRMGYTNVYDFGGIIDWPYDTVGG